MLDWGECRCIYVFQIHRLHILIQTIQEKGSYICQHSHIDHDIEEAFNRDESLESCGEVEIKTEIRSELFLFNSGCGDSDTHSAHLRFIPGIWVVVEPECDGDQDDGEDEEDEDADADVDQEASHHAVGCVDLHKVDFF